MILFDTTLIYLLKIYLLGKKKEKKYLLDWGYSSVVELLPSMCKALSSTLSTSMKEGQKEGKEGGMEEARKEERKKI